MEALYTVLDEIEIGCRSSIIIERFKLSLGLTSENLSAGGPDSIDRDTTTIAMKEFSIGLDEARLIIDKHLPIQSIVSFLPVNHQDSYRY
jgi:hypothetical protein